MALVDPRLLDKLHTSTKPPVDMTLRDLDAEMTNILDTTDIDVSEKVRLYNQALLRYNDMTKLAAAKPTPVVVVKEQNPDTPDVMAEVVTTLPKTPTHRMLWQRLWRRSLKGCKRRGVNWCRA